MASAAPILQPARGNWAPAPQTTIMLVWAAWALVLLAMRWSNIGSLTRLDPDDYMRLLQVRDLIAGQAWFDVHQYRFDPPRGAEMHWSRLVDVPLALALLAARMVLPEPLATGAAMTVVPLAQLLLALALTWRTMQTLGGTRGQALAAIVLFPLFPALQFNFAPMRIDHHGWQALALLGCTLLLLQAPSRRAALGAGALAAALLSISLEGLVMVVALAGLYGLRFVLFGERGVGAFLAGLAAASPVLLIATRPPSEYLPHCDSIGWPHLAAFATAALAFAASARLPASWLGDWRARAGLLGGIAAISAPIILVPVGICAINPFAGLDPLLREYWHGMILEGLPIHRQDVSTQVMLLWPALLTMLALLTGLPDRHQPLEQQRWPWLAAVALIAILFSCYVMRGALNAQIVSVPFAVVMIWRLMPHARAITAVLPRVLATVAVLLFSTPTVPALLAEIPNSIRESRRPAADQALKTCNLRALATLPPAMIFATTDIGPELVVHTPHRALASNYHRNPVALGKVIEAFSGDPAAAEGIVRAARADYLLFCLKSGDFQIDARRRPDNLASQLAAGRAPAWLEPVPSYWKGGLRLYRVRPRPVARPHAGVKVSATPLMQ